MGLRAACWTNFIHLVFGGLLLRVRQDPLFEKGKKEAKKRLKGTWASQAVLQSPSLGNRLRMQHLGLSAAHNGRRGEKTGVFSFKMPQSITHSALQFAKNTACVLHDRMYGIHIFPW